MKKLRKRFLGKATSVTLLRTPFYSTRIVKGNGNRTEKVIGNLLPGNDAFIECAANELVPSKKSSYCIIHHDDIPCLQTAEILRQHIAAKEGNPEILLLKETIDLQKMASPDMLSQRISEIIAKIPNVEHASVIFIAHRDEVNAVFRSANNIYFRSALSGKEDFLPHIGKASGAHINTHGSKKTQFVYNQHLVL